MAKTHALVVDAAVAGGLFAVGSGLCWLFRLNWAVANFLLLLLPAGYLIARSPRARHVISAVFVTKFVLFTVVFFNYLCKRFGGWDGPTAFPFDLQGVLIEEILWMGFYIPFVLTINEHFFASNDVGKPRRIVRTLISIMFFAGFVAVLVPQLRAFFSTYTYLKVGLVLYPPVFVMAIAVNRRIVRELLLTGLVAGVVCLVWEIIGLRNGFWHFPGTYVGHVGIVGYVFPVEELVFLILLSGPSVVATYSLYKNWKSINWTEK